MIFNKNTAYKTAELLLQINAIKLNPGNPFTWASGWKSPIYCDNRITLSYPQIRTCIREELVNVINANFPRPDVIAGVATGAIAVFIVVTAIEPACTAISTLQESYILPLKLYLP